VRPTRLTGRTLDAVQRPMGFSVTKRMGGEPATLLAPCTHAAPSPQESDLLAILWTEGARLHGRDYTGVGFVHPSQEGS
jgi:hypothetical protein